MMGFALLLSSTKVMALNANLTGLTISAGTLSPGFSATTYSYTSSENSSTASMTVTPSCTILGSVITVNGIITVTGLGSLPIALSPGIRNTITIVVTAVGYTTKTLYNNCNQAKY